MKMSLRLTNFPMKFYDGYVKALSQYAHCRIEIGGEDTVFLSCDANVVQCMEVVAITDLYYYSDKLPEWTDKFSTEGGSV